MVRYAYLVCINAGSNNYKFYEMKADEGTLVCKYGRVGGTNVATKTYPASKFDSIYSQKTRKGYEDKTEYYRQQAELKPEPSTEEVDGNEEQKPTDKGITKEQFELYLLLAKYTNSKIKKVFTNGETITQAMVEASKNCVLELEKHAQAKNKGAFNSVLKDLLAICPRKISGTGQCGVDAWLAHSENDFEKILDREVSLIHTMESKLLYIKLTGKNKEGYISHKVTEATQKQMEEVKNHLPYSLRQRIVKVYRVVPKKKTEDFKKWCEKNNIQKTKLLWHGSRNENWLSIVENSLQINPVNAIVNKSKMFGYGIYFAPDAIKSWGFTSSGKWTGGNSSINIMGLYETAYGKPYDCYYSEQMTQSKLDKMGCNCLHAHKMNGHQGTLYKDEIVYYSENAMCLKYIVIFGR